MKKITIAALFALSFATGFTCSKNAPEQAATTTTTETTTTATQEQMAAPASVDATMAQPTTETTTQPATETK